MKLSMKKSIWRRMKNPDRQTGRNVRNFLRDPAAITTEMIQASIHFLTQGLSIEEETAVEAMQNLVEASTPSEFVTAA